MKKKHFQNQGQSVNLPVLWTAPGLYFTPQTLLRNLHARAKSINFPEENRRQPCALRVSKAFAGHRKYWQWEKTRRIKVSQSWCFCSSKLKCEQVVQRLGGIFTTGHRALPHAESRAWSHSDTDPHRLLDWLPKAPQQLTGRRKSSQQRCWNSHINVKNERCPFPNTIYKE